MKLFELAKNHILGSIGLLVLVIFIFVGLYAPFFASSKPLVVEYNNSWYFPLFKYLFYTGFYTKNLDVFYNLLMFTLPIYLLFLWKIGSKRYLNIIFLGLQVFLFLFLVNRLSKDPVFNNPDYRAVKNAVEQYLDTNEKGNIGFIMMPVLSRYHWEEDAKGSQELNQKASFWNLTRINGKNLLASLIFGIRVSLSVGLIAVSIALIIGIPIGCIAGYYGAKVDMVICRFIEIWESMPTFFMLLLVVAILQTKSIFVVILVIGLFEWTLFARYTRAEFFKQKNLSYVEACKSLGFNDSYIIFTHILPNAIAPVLTLLSFSIMGAITTEAGLSFLGLGEEGSCSWGVLMDEGRNAFPAQSYLLWPPAILLTILLVAIALIGDAVRDILDPRLK